MLLAHSRSQWLTHLLFAAVFCFASPLPPSFAIVESFTTIVRLSFSITPSSFSLSSLLFQKPFSVGLDPFPLSILDIDFLSTSSFNLSRTSHLASFLIPLKPWIFALIAIRPRSRTRTPRLDSYCPWPAKTAPSAPSTFSKSSSRYVTPNHHIAFSQSKRKEFDHCRAISNPHHSLLYTPYFISPRTKTALYICTPICPCGHCQHHTQSLCTQLPQLAESLVRLILGLTPVSMLFLTSAHAGISLLSRLSRH